MLLPMHAAVNVCHKELCARHAALQVLEMLSHVNKRLQGQDNIKLPLKALLDLFLKPDAPPLTRNFALVYVETAFKRASPEERSGVVSAPPNCILHCTGRGQPSQVTCNVLNTEVASQS